MHANVITRIALLRKRIIPGKKSSLGWIVKKYVSVCYARKGRAIMAVNSHEQRCRDVT
jgi:hypothetical protein